MRVLMSGAGGFIGSALAAALAGAGHEVVRLTRGAGAPPSPSVIPWDPARGVLDASHLGALDAAVHLSGKNIAAFPWTPAHEKEVWESRVQSTRLLAETLARLERPPRVLVCASGTGYYGDRGDEVLTEEAGPGRGFLADLCVAWEGAAEPATAAGVRVVPLRLAMVLDRSGGALPRMLPAFRLGLGAWMGSGRQYTGWISLADAVGVMQHALGVESVRGPVNAVAPEPVTSRDFARALARALGRPAFLSAPAVVLRLAAGKLGEASLWSVRAVPARLQATGYDFRYPELDGALRAALARPPAG